MNTPPTQQDPWLRGPVAGIPALLRPEAETLLAALRETNRRGLDQLAATDESTLTQPRAVGRAHAGSTVLGLRFHAADHAARHSGQIVTTARLVRVSATTTTPA